jgi:hypothetical protein
MTYEKSISDFNQIELERSEAVRIGSCYRILLMNIVRPQSAELEQEAIVMARNVIDAELKRDKKTFKDIQPATKAVVDYLLEALA